MLNSCCFRRYNSYSSKLHHFGEQISPSSNSTLSLLLSGDHNRHFITAVIMNLNSPPSHPEPEPEPESQPVPLFPLTSSKRKIAIAVDLSNESAYAIRWAVQNYLRYGDTVILLHVRPTSVLYGADWGSDCSAATSETEKSLQKLEDDFASFTINKASDLAEPLVEAEIPFRIHIVKDHDMKERLCLEVERLGLSAVIMGSRGFGAAKGRVGSVSDYCVHHCVCPVVVVRRGMVGEAAELQPVPEEDASDEHKEIDHNTGKTPLISPMEENMLKLRSQILGWIIPCNL